MISYLGSLSRLPRWLRQYGRFVFWTLDARIAYSAAVVTGVACVTSEPIRGALTDPRVLGAIGAIGLAVVSVSLGSVALMAGLLDETFSFIIARSSPDFPDSPDQGILAALQPYQAMAVIGGTTIGAATVGMVATLAEDAWVVDAVVAPVTIFMGTWSVAGITRLVFLTAFFARKKGTVLATKAEANVRMLKSSGQANHKERGASAG